MDSLGGEFKVKYLWHIRKRLDENMEEMLRYLLTSEEAECNSVIFVADVFKKIIQCVDDELEQLRVSEDDF